MSREEFCSEFNYMSDMATEVTGISTVCETLVQTGMRESRWFTLTKGM